MTDLNKLNLMTGAEASERWGYERSYVKQMWKKSPEKFLKGSIVLIGNINKPIIVMTAEGMEHLTGMNEKEAKKRKSSS